MALPMLPRKTLSVVLAAAASAAATAALAQAPATSQADPHEWWKHAVFYEIYPRSFADSNRDGVGDLNGITSKLDYLKGLGVDALWITPCFPSPQVDFGYDVSDYRAIAPEYGSLADFDRLVGEAKKRGIRIVMDLVMNHSSDQHPWFTESRSSRQSPKRDWYMWRDGKEPGQPPNNWISLFGGSAWEWDATTGQYYYHFFYKQQPDLNWRNPAVKEAYFDVARYWMDRGVAGFRLDAIGTLFEDEALPDNPVKEGVNWLGDPRMENKYNTESPEVHDVIRELRKVTDSYPGDRVLIGETGGDDIGKVSLWYGAKLDEFQLPMNFLFTGVNKVSAPEFRKRIAEADKNPAGGWPVYLFSNHDQARNWNRYGDGAHNDAIAKVMAILYMTLRGTAIMYYGEELAMENNDPKRKEDVKDPIGRLGWPLEKGRDGERTPMQWDSTANAGFSKATPWLPVPASFKTKNVAAESKDPASMLNLYRKLTALRRSNEALREGEHVALAETDPNVLAYLRRTPGSAVLVALNMSASPQTLRPELASHGNKAARGKTLLATRRVAGTPLAVDSIPLMPFEALIAELLP